MEGKCALCERIGQLQDSHLIPRWAYKRVRDSGDTQWAAPICIKGGAAFSSSKQTKKHLLCSDCEQRFSKNEHLVAKLTERNEFGIKLNKYVSRCRTERKVLASLDRPEDGIALAYFGASIIWRSCVMFGACILGPYEVVFRRYLLGQIDLHQHVAISVGLFDESNHDIDPRGWVGEPSSCKTSIGWVHGFLIAGLAFRCWVGKSIPPEWLQVSLAGPKKEKYVSMLKPEECPDFLAAVDMLISAKPQGKLKTPR